MKMEKKMFGKQMFSGCAETVGHRTELEKKKKPFPGFSQSTIPSSYYSYL